MKIKLNELKEMIKKTIHQTLLESENYTARRQIKHAAEAASMSFEEEIYKQFNLEHPDRLPPELQQKHHLVVERMKDEVVAAVMHAVMELERFPKIQEGEKP